MSIEIIDSAIDNQLRKEVWDYLVNQTWYIKYKKDSSLDSYIPSQNGFDVPNKNPLSIHGVTMARTALAADEKYLKAKHKPIYAVWEKINAALGNKYTITGRPEGMPHDSLPECQPVTAIPGLAPGWRVYTNCQYQEPIKRSHGIHRDTPELDDETSVTILYVANLEWYPTWFGEIVYYTESDTGDKQQFQSVDDEAQKRNIPIGWADQIVSPIPGRIICYDGRRLHTTRPTAQWAPEPRVTLAFRARLK